MNPKPCEELGWQNGKFAYSQSFQNTLKKLHKEAGIEVQMSGIPGKESAWEKGSGSRKCCIDAAG